jgi:hypothetical protein
VQGRIRRRSGNPQTHLRTTNRHKAAGGSRWLVWMPRDRTRETAGMSMMREQNETAKHELDAVGSNAQRRRRHSRCGYARAVPRGEVMSGRDQGS